MTEKTYKRETAIAALVVLAGFYTWGVYNPEAAAAADSLVAFVFTFAGLAFGADAYAKQIK